MFCSKCGKELPEDTNFCPNCGNNLKQPIVAMQAQPIQTQPAQSNSKISGFGIAAIVLFICGIISYGGIALSGRNILSSPIFGDFGFFLGCNIFEWIAAGLLCKELNLQRKSKHRTAAVWFSTIAYSCLMMILFYNMYTASRIFFVVTLIIFAILSVVFFVLDNSYKSAGNHAMDWNAHSGIECNTDQRENKNDVIAAVIALGIIASLVIGIIIIY